MTAKQKKWLITCLVVGAVVAGLLLTKVIDIGGFQLFGPQ